MGSFLCSFRAAVIAAMAPAVCAAPVAAADPQGPPTVAPAATEVVMVDAVVVDRDGRPVTDLQRDDFVLREEGREQPITQFDRVRLDEVTGGPVARPPVSANTGPETGPPASLLAIAFDEQNLRPETLPDARNAVLHLLDRGLGAGDEIVLLATGSRDYWRARDKAGLEAMRARVSALRALRVRSPDEELVSDREAMQIEVYNDRQAVDNVVLRLYENDRTQAGLVTSRSDQARLGRIASFEDQARGLATRVWTEARSRAQATLVSLDGLAQLLAERRGRKSAVLVTDGFVLDGRWDQWKRTVEAARRSNLVVYAVDTRGLRLGAGLAAETGRTPSGSARIETTLAERETSEGSDALATETGGFTRRYTNDLGEALARIASETRSYYLLGFVPRAAPDATYHALSVEVRRPGLTVRARKGYWATAASGAATAGSDPVPLRLTAFVLEPRGEGLVHVQVVGEIDPAAIQFEDKGGRSSAAIEWVVDVLTPGRTGSEPPHRLRLSLTPEALASVRSGWVPVGAEFDLPQGVHVARLFVRDAGGDRAGTVEHDFEVPSPRSLYVSAVLSDLMRPQGGPAFLARRTFHAGGRLLSEFEVHNASTAEGAPRVLAGHEVRTADGLLLTRGEDSPMPEGTDGHLARLIRISLEKTPPGRYEIRLHVRDGVSGARLEWVEPFEVVAAATSSP